MDSKKILILLNDKDPVLTRVSKMKYEREAGWDAIIPASFDEAIQVFDQRKPDVVVTEIILNDPNGRSGFDFIEQIKATPHGTLSKMVILTDLSQDEDKQKAQALGVISYFVKSQISIKAFIEEMKKLFQ